MNDQTIVDLEVLIFREQDYFLSRLFLVAYVAIPYPAVRVIIY